MSALLLSLDASRAFPSQQDREAFRRTAGKERLPERFRDIPSNVDHPLAVIEEDEEEDVAADGDTSSESLSKWSDGGVFSKSQGVDRAISE